LATEQGIEKSFNEINDLQNVSKKQQAQNRSK
jgi:hypothetical protein